MKLYDFLTQNPGDYDTEDTKFVGPITVCSSHGGAYEEYDKFLDGLYQLVNVVRAPEPTRNLPTFEVDWSSFIHENRDLFFAFAKKQWDAEVGSAEDEEDAEFGLFKNLQALVSGYGSDDEYTNLVKEVIEPAKERERNKLKKYVVKLQPAAFTVEIEATNVGSAWKAAESMEFSDEELFDMLRDSVSNSPLRVVDAFAEA